MNAGKLFLVLFIILFVAVAQVGAQPSAKHCAEISVVDSFAAPETPHGLTFDGEHLYCAGRDSYPSNIYKLDAAGGVVDTFTGPGSVTGLAYKDGNIWAATDDLLTISELTTSGEVLRTFNAPGSDSTGLVFEHNALWNADFNWGEPVAYLHRIKITGKKMIVKTYEAPGAAPEGLAFDGVNLWHVDIFNSKLYKLNPATKVRCEYDIRDFTGGDGWGSGVSPIGLTFDGTYLWMAVQDDAMIYQLDIGE